MDRRAFIGTVAGGLLAAPLAVEAQQAGKMARIGYLSPGQRVSLDHPYLLAIRDGLQDEGFVVGRDVLVDWRFAENDYGRLPDLAAEIVQSRVAVFLCVTTPACRAAKDATTTTPIVMINVGDPVALGFVKSLGQPGGNITGLGLNSVEVVPKRLQLLKEVAPRSSRIGVLLRGGNPAHALQLKALEAAAQSLKLVLHAAEATNADGIDAAFAGFAQDHVDAAVVIPDPLLWDYRTRLGQLAINMRLPTVTEDRQFVEARMLMSYGPNEASYWRRSGLFVAKILRGAAPANLPVEQPPSSTSSSI